MALQKLMLDTIIVIDFLHHREPFFDDAYLLMLAARVGEFSLWISSSQVTDLIYILSDGGKKQKIPQALEKLRGLRTFVNVCEVNAADIDGMLAGCTEPLTGANQLEDPEDMLLLNLALRTRCDAIITRDAGFPASNMIRVHDCAGLFGWLEREKGISYNDVVF